MSAISHCLQVTALSKSYGTHKAVSDISFHVGSREIVGLLGPNGAGKTTTISMVLGVLAPTKGKILIDGIDVSQRRSAALAKTNFAAVYAALPGNLTVLQNLKVFARLYDIATPKNRIDELIRSFDLEKFRHTKCGVLSSGEQTRVALAKAMLNSPKLLLLDEPTASLDPSTAHDIRAQIKSFVAQGTGGVLWTSHNMYEVEEVCDRVLFLAAGRILLEGNPRTLPGEHGHANLEDLFISVARESAISINAFDGAPA